MRLRRRAQPFEESVKFHLLGGSENCADTGVDILPNGIVLRASLILALLEDLAPSPVPVGENRLDFGLLLGCQLELLGQLIEKGRPARTPIHARG